MILRAESFSAGERRGGRDRRRRKLYGLMAGGLRGRRRHIRRSGHGGIAAIDWYPARFFAVVLVTLLLSCADSLNTLALLGRGFIEVNPLMRALIEQGGPSFTLVKFGVTALSLIALTILMRAKAFGRFPAGAVLYGAMFFYLGLVGYELWMLGGLTLFD
jgi:Domain of unknown function (DUF5658)